MAMYLDTREEAERIIREGFVKHSELPVFFGTISLCNKEKWIIDFNAHDY